MFSILMNLKSILNNIFKILSSVSAEKMLFKNKFIFSNVKNSDNFLKNILFYFEIAIRMRIAFHI